MRKPFRTAPDAGGLLRDALRRIEVLERQESKGAPYSISEIADITPPVISGISHGTPGTSNATITWSTNEFAQSQVEYSTDSGLAGAVTTPYTSEWTLSHSVPLSGLLADTIYYYRVRSIDPSSNVAQSSILSFETAAPSVEVATWASTTTQWADGSAQWG